MVIDFATVVAVDMPSPENICIFSVAMVIVVMVVSIRVAREYLYFF